MSSDTYSGGSHGKDSFVTNNRIFCYTQIHFGLKNAQVEFQQMVNGVFKDSNQGSGDVASGHVGDIRKDPLGRNEA